MKIEADSDDINECPHDDTPCTGTFVFFKFNVFIQMFSTFIYMNMVLLSLPSFNSLQTFTFIFSTQTEPVAVFQAPVNKVDNCNND